MDDAKKTTLDTEVKGLRITGTGFTYRYEDASGRMKQIKLAAARSIEEARALAITYRQQRLAGIDPVAAKKARKAADAAALAAQRVQRGAVVYTLADAVEDYSKRHLDRLTDGDEMRRLLDKNLPAHLWKKPLQSITLLELTDAVEVMQDRGAKRSPVMFAVALRGLFRLARKRGRFVGHPADVVPTVDSQYVPRKRALADDEITKLWPFMDRYYSRAVTDVCKLAVLTCARTGELCSLQWSWIDWAGCVATIPAALTKNRRRRGAEAFQIWLNPQALEILRRRRAEAKQGAVFVFPGRDHVDEHMRQNTVSLTPVRFRDKQTFGAFTAHDLRRTGATLLGRMHCPRQVQDKILNHIDNSIGATYDRSDLGPQALQWVCKLGERVAALTATPAGADVVALSQVA